MKKDLCLSCGKDVDCELWGGKCEDGHITVHRGYCNSCGGVIGFITDDDYCGPEILICTDCMNDVIQLNGLPASVIAKIKESK